MGELVGYVTQTRGAPFEGIEGTHRGDSTGRSLTAFTATRKNGAVVGATFTTQQEARRALQNEVGPPLLQWRRADTNNNRIERYEGRDPRFYPGDLRLTGGAWLRGDQGVRQSAGPTSSDPRRVARWSSFNTPGTLTAATEATVATRPAFGEGAMGGRDALVFDTTELRHMDMNLTLAPDYEVHSVARWRDAGRDQIVVQSDGGFFISVDAGGDWMVDAGGTLINAGAAVAGQIELITVRSDASGPSTEVYRNGTLVGSAASAPASGLFSVSDPADAWYEHIGEILIIPELPNFRITEQLFGYFGRRYPLG
jgi:hypothetical protein